MLSSYISGPYDGHVDHAIGSSPRTTVIQLPWPVTVHILAQGYSAAHGEDSVGRGKLIAYDTEMRRVLEAPA